MSNCVHIATSKLDRLFKRYFRVTRATHAKHFSKINDPIDDCSHLNCHNNATFYGLSARLKPICLYHLDWESFSKMKEEKEKKMIQTKRAIRASDGMKPTNNEEVKCRAFNENQGIWSGKLMKILWLVSKVNYPCALKACDWLTDSLTGWLADCVCVCVYVTFWHLQKWAILFSFTQIIIEVHDKYYCCYESVWHTMSDWSLLFWCHAHDWVCLRNDKLGDKAVEN